MNCGSASVILQVVCVAVILGQVFSWEPELTKGKVWPLPRHIVQKTSFSVINPTKFQFKIDGLTCEILEHAIKRYTKVVKETNALNHKDTLCKCGQGCLDSVVVHLANPCEEWPHLHMDEHYKLEMSSTGGAPAMIYSDSVWGILRGLETFSQLVTPSPDPACLMINDTIIDDSPAFTHRGLLLDTSRHYLPISVICNILSAMEMNKMNVFHWHIVDDHSFPYQSTTFPSLSEKGAYKQDFIYTPKMVQNIIQYARFRGIRVIPEFDSPGHTQSWGRGMSNLLTPCYREDKLDGTFGPVDPSQNETFEFMTSLLKEIKSMFPESYVHIGGDEVDDTCWSSNPAISKFMKDNKIHTYWELESYYVQKVLDIVNTIDRRAIVWQEVFVHADKLRKDTVVQVWLGERSRLLNEITKQGLYALSSEGWYLDAIQTSWNQYYSVDILDFNATKEQIALVLGGEACMWGEMVDEDNIVPRIWPRASAVAERLWSDSKVNHTYLFDPMYETSKRLNEHVCRMKRRGVAAEPANGPGFCPY